MNVHATWTTLTGLFSPRAVYGSTETESEATVRTPTRFWAGVLAFGLVCLAGPSSAALVTVPLSGLVTNVSDPDIDASVGDRVRLRVTFDAALVGDPRFTDPVTGTSFIPLDGTAGDPGADLKITFNGGGSQPLVLTAIYDVDYGFGFPVVVVGKTRPDPVLFESVDLVDPLGFDGLGYVVFGSQLQGFALLNVAGEELLSGTYAAVPLPGSALLLLAGLATVSLLGRRRAAIATMT